ncbi:HNH endonuclease signature motif containing protein [Bovifimicola ammoniilytica]|uniref:HNH endonuclease signature motif containing protein n=1 Tax=Bovifimicola ammoniilytica TaxID=2981720 RepID=UPI0011C88DFD|nr:HNH endonuclease signature motif containing protein [Bovifimicola ammoniilytica]MCU6754660.1 HNH endonuclease [Bovifimicola ammoniilytica]
MAALSMMSALPMIGNIASGIMTAAKITTVAKIVSTVCKVVSNAATFTQAAIGGVNNAKAIVKNMINGKLFSEDTAKNLVSFGINAFTAATSGKNLLSSSKELKKVVGDSAGSKWGKKAKKEPLLECNLQFFADKNGCESGSGSSFTGKLRGEDVTLNNVNVQDITLKKRSSSGLSQLRSEFNTSVRKDFLMDMGKQTEYLRSAGFMEADILKIQNGYVPTGWQVHHKIPLDGGGTNDFSNMVLIQNEPYHKVLTNYQNSVMKDMNEGDIIVVAWP